MGHRRCDECANAVSWTEYGYFMWDCGAPGTKDADWRINIAEWLNDELAPARYCGDFVLATPP